MPADSGTVGTEPTAAGEGAASVRKGFCRILSVSARWNSIAGTARRAVGVLLVLLGVYQDLAEPQREEEKEGKIRGSLEAMTLIARRVSQEEFCAGDNCAENGGQPHNAEPSVSEENRLVTRTVSAGISAAAVKSCCRWG